MSHACRKGCPHWCEGSPIKRHRWVFTQGLRQTTGVCRYCGKKRVIRDPTYRTSWGDYGQEEG